MAGHIIPMSYSYSKFLFFSSFSMAVSAVIAYIMNDFYITVYMFLLCFTSINHWRKPEYGLRRNIDLTIVSIGILYAVLKLFLLKNEFYRVCLLILGFCGIIFYVLEYILSYLDSPKWIIFHMAIHMYTSCAACLMLFD